MNEQKTNTPKAEPVHFEHYCQRPGCKRWGSFGYDLGRGETEWWCGQHRSE